MFLVLISDHLVFIITEIYNFVTIFSVKLRLFIHVQNPSIIIQFEVLRRIMQCSGFEQRIEGCNIIMRHHNLSHQVSSRPKVHVIVSQHFYLPVSSNVQTWHFDRLPYVQTGLDRLLLVHSFCHKPNVDFGFEIVIT